MRASLSAVGKTGGVNSAGQTSKCRDRGWFEADLHEADADAAVSAHSAVYPGIDTNSSTDPVNQLNQWYAPSHVRTEKRN